MTERELFISACKNGDVEYIRNFKTSNKVDIKLLYECGLIHASLNGKEDLVRYILSIGTDVDAQCGSPIRCATKFGYLNLVKYFVENGSKHADWCLVYAVRFDKIDIMKYLIEEVKVSLEFGDRMALKVARSKEDDAIYAYLSKEYKRRREEN